jgi:ribonucleoside-diphosphate reductase alpha chain
MGLTEIGISFLTGSGVTVDTASASDLSKALAYQTCYNWYIENQKVLPENAALASKVWVQKYCLIDENGLCVEKDPSQMWKRIAITLAEVEVATNPVNKNFDYWENYFMTGLNNYGYSPQGSGLYSLGNPYVRASSSNCFVLPPPTDSLEGIFETAKNTAKIYAARGGVGFNLSGLRPRKAKTANAAKTSTGAVSFMDFYSYVTGMIGQEGRRGAEMLSMSVSHPDIFAFIDEKRDLDKQSFFEELAITGIDINDYKWSAIADRLKSTSHANVSVMINDHFMNCVKNDLDYELRFDFENNLYPSITKTVKATDIWNKLMKSAWESAEPGILNWDHITRECPADQYGENTIYDWIDPVNNPEAGDHGHRKSLYSFRTVGVNPCAEETLSAFDSCNLGIFNLPSFVINPYKDNAKFDWERYEEVIKLGIRAQDNIKEWDLPRLPLEGNRMAGVLGRRISVGNTGLADCLAALGLQYDSDKGLDVAEKIYEFLANTAYQASAVLASEKGAFPAFNLEKHLNSPFIQRLNKTTLTLIKKHGLRNIGLLTQAPAGSMSILFRNCSSGIEPVFMLNYLRNVKKPGTKDFEQHTINHQAVEDCFQAGGKAEWFVPASQIDYSKRIQMQSRIQKHIDHSISSTINLPNSVTVEEVSKIYMEAYDAGLKGITVYRDGCRTGVLVSAEKKIQAHRPGQVIERPKTTDVDIFKTKYKEKNYMILVGKVENGHPIEIFGGLEDGLSLPTSYKSATLTKKSRGHYSLTVQLSDDEEDILKVNNVGNRFPAQDIMTLTRMISLSLRNGISVSDIVEQLNKATTALYDAPAVFARVLKQYITDEEVITKEKAKGKLCPECGAALEYKRESGCVTELCSSCTYSNSKCG